MSSGKNLRWRTYWALDRIKGGRVGAYYQKIRDSYENGTEKSGLDAKIRGLIAHAVKTTPFYSAFDPDTPLEKMPVINKETVRADYSAFASSAFRDAPDNRTMYTSGSTGTPFAVVQNLEKIRHNTAASIFLNSLTGYEIGRKVAFIRMWVGDHAKRSRLSLFAENLLQEDCGNLGDAELLQMLDRFRKKRVEVLTGYAAQLTDISSCIDRHHYDTSGFSVKGIMPISEHMADPVRRALARQFRCPVRSNYSNEENGIMAVQYGDGPEYYVDTESYWYEILKMDSDEPAERGELGRIVVTDLWNYATPLIRYENGDLAIAECTEKNGRIRLELKELYGRRVDLIYDTKGRTVSPFVLYNGLAMTEGLRQYRFIQEDVRRYTLELNGDRNVMDVDAILGAVRPFFGEDAEIEVAYVDEIPVLSSGKRKNIVNRCERYRKK